MGCLTVSVLVVNDVRNSLRITSDNIFYNIDFMSNFKKKIVTKKSFIEWKAVFVNHISSIFTQFFKIAINYILKTSYVIWNHSFAKLDEGCYCIH